jgi:hypothetical protein
MRSGVLAVELDSRGPHGLQPSAGLLVGLLCSRSVHVTRVARHSLDRKKANRANEAHRPYVYSRDLYRTIDKVATSPLQQARTVAKETVRSTLPLMYAVECVNPDPSSLRRCRPSQRHGAGRSKRREATHTPPFRRPRWREGLCGTSTCRGDYLCQPQFFVQQFDR